MSTADFSVALVVDKGLARVDCTVSYELISNSSPFFAVAFKKSSFESATRTMYLPDVPGKTFKLLENWLHTRSIQIPTGSQTFVSVLKGSAPTIPIQSPGFQPAAALLPLASLWELADRFLMPELQNDAMDLLVPLLQYIRGDAVEEFTIFAYALSVENTQLKNLAVERIAWSVTVDEMEYERYVDAMPLDVTSDVVGIAGELYEMGGLGPSWPILGRDSSWYHVTI